jgi:hypothetical protein
MIDWLNQLWQSLSWNQILLGASLFVGSLTISFGAIVLVMVKIPADYFSPHYEQNFLPNTHWTMKWGAMILKNLLGIFLILLGIMLSLPGIPGQGLLTILLGLIMLDIPGKRPLEARIIQRPSILAAINKLRARFKKPPLILN